ncbi:MAG: TonB-dependent siderophore receptor [Halioglobus sp.]
MKHFSLYLHAFGLAALTGSFSSAQASNPADRVLQEEVIVRGQYLQSNRVNALRTPTPILEVPQSLSIVTSELIQRQAFTTLGDIVNYTAGVNNSQGEGHRDAIVFRGIRSTADFFIDGTRDDVQYYRPLYNLEQVEILRGPNALLFGRGGAGGILNRVTKKGLIGVNANDFLATADSFGGYNLQIDTNHAISDNAALRFNAYYEGVESERDYTDGDRLGVNPTAKVLLGESTVVDLSYEYIDHQQFIDRGIPTGANGKPVGDFDDIVFGDRNLNESTLEAHLLRAMLQHAFSDALKANASLFYGDYEKAYTNFYASAYDEQASPDVVTLDGYIDTTDRQNLIFTGNLVGQFDTASIGHTVLFGAEYIDTDSDQDRFNAFWDTTQDDTEVFAISRPLKLRGGVGVNAAGQLATNDFSADLNDDTRVELEVYSIYLQDEIALTERLDIILGARYDSIDIEVDNVPQSEVRSASDEEVSPRGGLVFKPAENLSLYAAYSETFLPRSGEQYDNINGDNDSLAPDEFKSKEVGMKWDFARDLSLTLAYFENEQTVAGRDNDTGENFEVRGLEVDGFELQVEGRITDDLFIRGGYSYFDGSTGGGEEPRELPENMASIWGNYQIDSQWAVGLGATYQDESLINDGGSAKLPAYTRVDAAVYYQLSETLRIQLNVENLLDEEYYPYAHSTHQVSVGEPLNVRLTVTGSF